MILFACLALMTLVAPLSAAAVQADVPSERALRLASKVRRAEAQAAEETLAALVAFDTYHREGTPNAEHPSFQAMTRWLKAFADANGLDFADHGAVVVVGLGDGPGRLGVVTHGDVQPCDPAKWAADPFTVDVSSEPGRLVGRGTEDDKGPIACALHAMKAIGESGWDVRRRIELIISYTEESDWTPFGEFLARNPPPDLNVAIDAEYPVVVAEKGWCSVEVSLPIEDEGEVDLKDAALTSFTGGFFLSQVPEDAVARVDGAHLVVEDALRRASQDDDEVEFSFEREGDALIVRAKGTSAHSSKPEQGRNGITHMARLLSQVDWPPTAASRMVSFINELIGVGWHGELFGELAYEDEFMGPLTLSLGKLEERDGRLVAGINLRRPVGRSGEQVEAHVREAVHAWSMTHGIAGVEVTASIGEPHPPVDAPHVPVLLSTFRHYTGIQDAAPISIGGGTHARMVPNGVNFGPSMPGEPYTGHSEHEFITRERFLQNLEMYTSLLVDLAVEPRALLESK